MPAEPDACTEEHADNPTDSTGSQLRCVHGDWLAVPLCAVPRERLEPQDDERGCGDRRDEHYAKRHERLISACREPGNSSLTSSSSSIRLRIGFPRLVGLAKGKAVGIEVAHVACVGVGPGLD